MFQNLEISIAVVFAKRNIRTELCILQIIYFLTGAFPHKNLYLTTTFNRIFFGTSFCTSMVLWYPLLGKYLRVLWLLPSFHKAFPYIKFFYAFLIHKTNLVHLKSAKKLHVHFYYWSSTMVFRFAFKIAGSIANCITSCRFRSKIV